MHDAKTELYKVITETKAIHDKNKCSSHNKNDINITRDGRTKIVNKAKYTKHQYKIENEQQEKKITE